MPGWPMDSAVPGFSSKNPPEGHYIGVIPIKIPLLSGFGLT